MNLDRALEIVSETDVGMVRSGNEDSVATDPSIGVAVLADGMGGYNAGEVASGMATAAVVAEMRHMPGRNLAPEAGADTGLSDAQRLLRDILCRVNTSVHETSQSRPQYSGMGTTLVAAWFHDGKITVAHVGDSRLYRMRGAELRQVTRDHSLLQAQIDAGLLTPEEAKLSAHKNLIMRALGISATVEPEVHDYDALKGDIYLLCSDGLSGMVSDWHIGLALRTFRADLKSCARKLIQMANENGGRDNVSVILIRVLSSFP